jgi:hypothetical protein
MEEPTAEEETENRSLCLEENSDDRVVRFTAGNSQKTGKCSILLVSKSL